MEHLIHIIGYLMLWGAVFYKRKGESDIKVLSWDYLIIFLLITFGAIISQYGS